MDNPKILICDCSSVEHQLVFNYDDEDNVCYVSIHLNRHYSFWERLKCAIKYLFGYKCKYGDFEEIILSNKHAKYLKELANNLEQNGKTCID